jgi:hypothetical protein
MYISISPCFYKQSTLFLSQPLPFHHIHPYHFLQVSFVYKKLAIRIAGISISSLAVMAATFPFATVSPICTSSNIEIHQEDETLSSRSQPQSEKPVKAGCCARVHRHKNRNVDTSLKASRKAQLRKAAKDRVVEYLRYTWIDSLILAIFGIIILCLYWAPNNLRSAPLIPIWPAVPVNGSTAGKFLDLRAPTEFQYPWQKSPLNDIVCAVIITVVPIIVIAFFQLKVRSCWDFHAGQLGVLKAVTTT